MPLPADVDRSHRFGVGEGNAANKESSKVSMAFLSPAVGGQLPALGYMPLRWTNILLLSSFNPANSVSSFSAESMNFSNFFVESTTVAARERAASACSWDDADVASKAWGHRKRMAFQTRAKRPSDSE